MAIWVVGRRRLPAWKCRYWVNQIQQLWPFQTRRTRLQILVRKLAGQGLVGGLLHLRRVLLHELLIDLSSGRCQGGGSDEVLHEISDALHRRWATSITTGSARTS